LCASAASAANEACLSCHAKEVVSGYVDPHQYAQSAHGKLKCVQCHSDLSEQKLPHGPKAKKVDCAKCHATGDNGAPQVAALIKAYKDSIHGHAALERKVKEAPTCTNCHGAHDIFPKKDKRSKVHHANVPLTCGKCHSDQKLVDKFDIPKGEALKYFERSVHGQLLSKGNMRAAVCTDCHGAHNIQPGDVAVSTVAHKRVPDTCGKCHKDIKEKYLVSIHGRDFLKGVKQAPICTSCHGEHTIRSSREEASSVHATHIHETCGKCHESKAIQARFGLPTQRMATFRESYHGVALKFGEVQVANCATCHGAHDILPSSDPRSWVHPDNIPKTCGKCHAGASANFALGKVHVEATPESNVGVYFISLFYRVMIWSMTLLFFGMIFLDLIARVKERRRHRSHPPNNPHGGGASAETSNVVEGEDEDKIQIERMPLHARIQHLLTIISVGTLMMTGLPLRYPNIGWLETILTFPGSFALRAWLHRAAAVLLIVLSVYHIFYVLCSPTGHRDFMALLPTRQDGRDFIRTMKYYFGLAPDRPLFGRFSYVEKFEYLAIVWGSIVMILTGFILWFMVAAMMVLPKWAWDIARAMHGYEALLAFIAIIVWHFYCVHFNPSVFPMSKVWLTGKITLHQMKEEHPLEYEEWKEKHGRSEHD
jgi:cytochrome b subunit of formate dehydrogenase